MKYKSFFISLSVLLFFVSSCNNEDRVKVEIKNLMNRKVLFPMCYESIPNKDSVIVNSMLDKDVKIVSYVDDLPCTSCGIKMMSIWMSKIDSLNSNVEYLVVVNVAENDKSKFFDMMDSAQLPHPIIYYDTDTFGVVNGLSELFAVNKTFLLNKHNRIVLVGEPFNNEKLFDLYKKTIMDLSQ